MHGGRGRSGRNGCGGRAGGDGAFDILLHIAGRKQDKLRLRAVVRKQLRFADAADGDMLRAELAVYARRLKQPQPVGVRFQHRDDLNAAFFLKFQIVSDKRVRLDD